MREILFRGKTEKAEWVEGGLLYDEEQNEAYIAEHFEDKSAYLRPIIPETVGQYIGTEINGKKVFEGHIVKCRHEWQPKEEDYFYHESETLEKFNEQKIKYAYGKHTDIGGWGGTVYYYYRNYVVEYDKKTGGWRLRNGNVIHEIKVGTLYNRRSEIIGNIHDNPELLKGGE